MAHYVDNKKLFEEMCVFVSLCAEAKECGDPRPKVPDYIGLCIYQIANRLSMRPNFIGYSYRDEMVGDGIENCLTYLHNFNPEKSSNPFAYFTQIIYFAFLRRIQKEKKQLYIKHKSFENSLIDQTLFDTMTDDEYRDYSALNPLPDISRITDLVNMFEPTKEVKTKKPKGIEKFIEEEGNDDAAERNDSDPS